MKVLPYVYICTHKKSGEFYIGSRMANKVPAIKDLGSIYKTSSNDVKPFFENFNFIIFAEFFNKDDAWFFEQSLIKKHIKNPLIINKGYINSKGKKCFHTAGRKRTESEKIAISKNKTGKKRKFSTRTKKLRTEYKYICEHCNNEFSKFYCDGNKQRLHKHRFCSPSCRNKKLSKNRTNDWRLNQSISHKGNKHTAETKLKISNTLKNKRTFN